MLFLVMTLLFPLASWAADYPWLTFTMKDHTEISVASDNLDITFTDNNLRIVSSVVNQTIPVSRIASMKFNVSVTGVDEIEKDGVVPMSYYDLSGKYVGRYVSRDAAREALPSGIYIVKDRKKNSKIIF